MVNMENNGSFVLSRHRRRLEVQVQHMSLAELSPAARLSDANREMMPTHVCACAWNRALASSRASRVGVVSAGGGEESMMEAASRPALLPMGERRRQRRSRVKASAHHHVRAGPAGSRAAQGSPISQKFQALQGEESKEETRARHRGAREPPGPLSQG